MAHLSTAILYHFMTLHKSYFTKLSTSMHLMEDSCTFFQSSPSYKDDAKLLGIKMSGFMGMSC